MIEHLSGTVIGKTDKMIVIDVNGVGYGVEVPETLQTHGIEIGDSIKTWVHTYVREDAIRLFGFRTFEERQLFNMLISVSDIGPKLGMSILSSINFQTLIQAIETEDVAMIEEVPGIGPRKSKKILLELKPKLTKMLSTGLLKLQFTPGPLELASPAGAKKAVGIPAKSLDRATVEDLKSALSNLGYREKEFLPVVRRLELDPPSFDLGDLIKAALADIMSGSRGAAIAKASDKLEEIF